MDRVLERAIATYGDEDQYSHVIGVLASLIESMTELKRHEDDSSYRLRVIAGIGSVEIAMDALKIILDCEPTVGVAKHFELQAIEQRLEAEKMKDFYARLK